MSLWRQAVDHVRHVAASARGFRYLRFSWLPIWLLYLVHPVAGRLFRRRVVDLGGIRVRLGTTDCYCLANLPCDYDLAFLRRTVPEIDTVVDGGANVGAFSYLALRLRPQLHVVALEPERDCFELLSRQPFAPRIEARRTALGAREGVGRVVLGTNEAAATVVAEPSDDPVPIQTLATVCRGRTLVKLDVEGAEREILATPLPDEVTALVLEWHYPDEPVHLQADGRWSLVMRDASGSSCWSWRRR